MSSVVKFILAVIAGGLCTTFVNSDPVTENNEIPPFNNPHRIVGGVEVSINELSYQVSVQIYQQHVCGGTILDSTFVLTAAHCFWPKKSRPTSVRVGSNSTVQGGTWIKVCGIIVHRNYNDTTMDNDICLLKLCEPLRFSKSIRPITLPWENTYLYPGTLATVSGWGYDKENGKLTPTLRKVEVPIVPTAVCRRKYQYISYITDYQICAGFTQGGKDSCQGDSGGPLVYNNTLIGIVSYGMGCATEYPGVYTFVPKYINWIIRNANLTQIVQPVQPTHWYDVFLSWFRNSATSNSSASKIGKIMPIFCIILIILK